MKTQTGNIRTHNTCKTQQPLICLENTSTSVLVLEYFRKFYLNHRDLILACFYWNICEYSNNRNITNKMFLFCSEGEKKWTSEILYLFVNLTKYPLKKPLILKPKVRMLTHSQLCTRKSSCRISLITLSSHNT